MAPPSPFLALPREIRDAIYEHYVAIPGGYVCDPGRFAANVLERNAASVPKINITGLLKGANDQPINLNLCYTCRLIATEMYGVALRINPITFTTVYSDDLRMIALRFDKLIGELEYYRHRLFYSACHTIAEKEAHHELKSTYPQFAFLLNTIREEADLSDPRFNRDGDLWALDSYGEAPSLLSKLHREGLRHVACLDTGRDAFHRWLDRYEPHRVNYAETHDFGGMAKDPSEFWDIPQYSRLQAMAAYWPHGEDTDSIEDVITKRDRVKHRFSAAAAAVLFMKSCDRALRMQLRKIIVHEDRKAVGHPARHAQGLIPFCQENPLLVVERRVDLWRNAIQSEPHHRPNLSHPMSNYGTYRRDWVIESQYFSESILIWIVEALALAPAGMPVKSFSLVLDAEPAPHLMTEMFQAIVQHDAAWQQAWDESVKRGMIKEPSWLDGSPRMDWYPSYTFKHLPQALRDIAEEKSVVRCNFNIGEPWDFERLVREHKGWSHANWAKNWGDEHKRKHWETESPLPSWKSILEENLLPVPDDHVHYGDSDSELDL
ncbi:hypothetical protein CGCSCA4_v014418 [Colletotrichum siamense]|uniref:Uncharacterized protein n=1 Tax=Colletotrichum siamense TaxID=690259 RepID=A0A9P5BLM1_COLSI|nr:hypothetical protein CGCSCA4_v014418 [Colletotrichum siamense]KAF4842500.1 hypothetical protein CGCSCA2_v014594 [Colletotrichum siamense]